MKIKIPNYLTIGRIIIVPIFVLTFYLPGFYGDIIPFSLFVIASFTDFLDGLLARMYKEESKLGELLDPIADKIIVATALILLVMDGTIKNFEVIAAIIILTREILISGLREFLAKGKIKLPVSSLAKLKTVLQMVSIALLLSGETGNKIINNILILSGKYNLFSFVKINFNFYISLYLYPTPYKVSIWSKFLSKTLNFLLILLI